MGDVTVTQADIIRFWSKVDKRGPNECWPWIGSSTPAGYGRFRNAGRTVAAHRMAWELENGQPFTAQCACHKCDNPRCVNPAHIFPGSYSDNIRDAIEKGRFIGWQARKTHCLRGHPLVGENVQIVKGKYRRCKACTKEYFLSWQRKSRAKKKG